jgi:hypothetical protein
VEQWSFLHPQVLIRTVGLRRKLAEPVPFILFEFVARVRQF